jgi:hypothetical protein
MKKYTKCGFVFLGLLMIINPLYSQVKQSHSIVLGFLQLKDELNLGMVFNGIALEYRYGLLWKIHDNEILYQPKLSFGAAFSHGMTGVRIKIAPVNVTWTRPFFQSGEHTITGGVNFLTDYNFQAYPYLHIPHLFWTSEIGLSPVLRYNYQWDSRRIGIGVQNSLLGFTSHTQGYDPVFCSSDYPLDIKSYFVKPHENMQFGSFNKYNHTNISLEFVPDILKIHSLAYEFDYFASFYGSQFRQLNHNVIWRMSL